MSFNDYISPPGYEALTQGFKKLTNLTQLKLSSFNITDKSFDYLCNIFEKCKNISVLDFSINNIISLGFIKFYFKFK